VKSRKPKPLTESGLLDYALRALSARSLTQGELRVRLQARAARPGDVETVVGRLKQSGYLDDRRFAETFSRLRRENEGFGKLRVLRDLRRRRIGPSLAAKAVAEAYRDAEEAELIDRFLKRKLRYGDQPPALDDPRRVASFYRMLLRAGFTSAKILEALRKLSAQSEWVDSLETTAEEEDSD